MRESCFSIGGRLAVVRQDLEFRHDLQHFAAWPQIRPRLYALPAMRESCFPIGGRSVGVRRDVGFRYELQHFEACAKIGPQLCRAWPQVGRRLFPRAATQGCFLSAVVHPGLGFRQYLHYFEACSQIHGRKMGFESVTALPCGRAVFLSTVLHQDVGFRHYLQHFEA